MVCVPGIRQINVLDSNAGLQDATPFSRTGEQRGVADESHLARGGRIVGEVILRG